LLAAVSADPGVIVTLETSLGAYVRVHCKPAAPLPPLKERLTTAVPAEAAEPVDKESPPVCAKAETGLRSTREKARGKQRLLRGVIVIYL
jgi:hypothetical protein